MSDVIISVENLGKCYRINHQQSGPNEGLRHLLNHWATAPLRALQAARQNPGAISGNPSASEDFWALRDVSFEIKQGEVVGIIGRNGAGKSTLLKILSRITEPTKGRVRIKGRVASLLEVGTGFHPELTGRENVYLNGTILGMSRAEIKKKFDEIVAFAEVEKFLDTPVKRYSSGMYVRLAFAVAAHLEPEILIVDEVLAVGDAQFQKKCLGKMQEVSKGGRTVIFVSHNMGAMQSLCDKACYLQMGELKAHGDVSVLISQYQSDVNPGGDKQLKEPLKLGDELEILLLDLTPKSVKCGKSMRFALDFKARQNLRITDLALLIYSERGVRVSLLDLRVYGLPASLPAGKIWQVSGEIISVPLVEGTYRVGIYINTENFMSDIFDLATFTIEPVGDPRCPIPYSHVHRGFVELDFTASFHQSTS